MVAASFLRIFLPPAYVNGTGGSKWEILGPDAALVGKGPERVLFSKLAMEPTVPKAGVTATAAGVDNSRAHSAIEAWAGNLKNGLDEGLAFTAQWLGIADTVTANVSTDFRSADRQHGRGQDYWRLAEARRLSAKTERSELKRRSILGPDFREEDEEQRLAEEQQGLEPEQPMNPVTGEVLA